MTVKTRKKIDPEKLEKAAEILKCIAHPVRLAVLELLDTQVELSVSELLEKTGIEQSLLSHHLTKMKDKGVLKASRDGKNIYYRLAEKEITKIFDCMEKCDFL